jgi:hypothetical protein
MLKKGITTFSIKIITTFIFNFLKLNIYEIPHK